MLPLAVYIHWPFCLAKCPYCDFNSHVRERIDEAAYVHAYETELEFWRDWTGPRAVTSVFFGGGTPSLMAPATTAAVLASVDRLWGLPADVEITLEANPTSVERDRLRGFRAAGVNRVSLGVQSLRDADLKTLGRAHSAQEALAALDLAASVFDRFSFDLIYARPGQTVATWRQELAEALTLGARHLSLYQLTIEEGTQYHTLHRRGALTLPDDDTAADMYQLTQEMTAAAGLAAYEVSNHAAPGDESRHNLAYWRYADYAGIGPGAHGRLTVDGVKHATRTHRAPEVWLRKTQETRHGMHPFEIIDFNQRAKEMLLMGLRLSEGVSLDHFRKETHTDLTRFVQARHLQELRNEGWLELDSQRLCVTPAGRLRLNALLSHLLST